MPAVRQRPGAGLYTKLEGGEGQRRLAASPWAGANPPCEQSSPKQSRYLAARYSSFAGNKGSGRSRTGLPLDYLPGTALLFGCGIWSRVLPQQGQLASQKARRCGRGSCRMSRSRRARARCSRVNTATSFQVQTCPAAPRTGKLMRELDQRMGCHIGG